MKTSAISMFAAALAASGVIAAESAKITVSLDRPVLPAAKAQHCYVKVELEAPSLPPAKAKRMPVNLCLVLDRSGSMTGERIARARDAVAEVVRHLSREDILSIVTYDDSAEVVVPAQHVENPESFMPTIRSILPRGCTALFAGVSQGAAELRKNVAGPYVSRLVLLSDGQANVGPDSPAALGDLGASLAREKIGVSTVGLGVGYNEELMLTLAQKSGANAYFAENPRDLERIFTDELGDALTTVVRGTVVTVKGTNGVKPVSVIGFDSKIDGVTATIPIDSLGGGQKKYVLVELEVPAASAGTSLGLADISIGYETVADCRKRTLDGQAVAKFSDEDAVVKSSVDKGVAREVLRMKNAETKQKMYESNLRRNLGDVDVLGRIQSSFNSDAAAAYDMEDAEMKEFQDELSAAREEASRAPMSGRKLKFRLSKSRGELNQQRTSSVGGSTDADSTEKTR